MLGEQGSRQFSAFICVHQPDGFKDLLTGDFCCRRLFVLPGLGCCRGQVLGIEVCFDFLGQLQPGLVLRVGVRSDRTKQKPRIFLSRWTLKRFWGLCNVFQRLLNNSLDFRTYKVSKVIDNIDKVMGQIRLDILHRSIHDSLTAFFRSP